MQLLLLLLSHFSRVRLCATSLMAAHQAPMSLGFSRQKYWSGLPFPSPMHACMLSCFSHVLLCATPWTTAHQAPLSTGFSRQEYWSGLPFPSPHTQLVNIYWAPHTGQHCSRNRGDCAGQKKKKQTRFQASEHLQSSGGRQKETDINEMNNISCKIISVTVNNREQVMNIYYVSDISTLSD